MDLIERVKTIIEKVSYASIATLSPEGEVWNAPVFIAYDKDYNFYWGTYRNSQKSKNIRANKNVFLAIYDSKTPPGEGQGVYIRANAAELTDPKEIEFAHKLLWDRHIVPYWKLEQCTGDTPIRLYKAIPEKIWTNGEGREDGHYIDTRIEVKL